MRTLLIVAMALALSGTLIHAAPPDNADPAMAPWFKSLKQPGTGAECCSISDCRAVEVRRDSQGYEVKVDQKWHLSAAFWLRVPAERIIDVWPASHSRTIAAFCMRKRQALAMQVSGIATSRSR